MSSITTATAPTQSRKDELYNRFGMDRLDLCKTQLFPRCSELAKEKNEAVKSECDRMLERCVTSRKIVVALQQKLN